MEDLYENTHQSETWNLLELLFVDSRADRELTTHLAELLSKDNNRLILDLGCPIPILGADLENSFGGCSFVAAIHFHFTTIEALKRCWDDISCHLSADTALFWQWCPFKQYGSIVIVMAEHLEAEQCLEDVIMRVEHILGWRRQVGRPLCFEFGCNDCRRPLWSAAERACLELTFWKDAELWWSRREQTFTVADGYLLLGDRQKLARVYGCKDWLQSLLPYGFGPYGLNVIIDGHNV